MMDDDVCGAAFSSSTQGRGRAHDPARQPSPSFAQLVGIEPPTYEGRCAMDWRGASGCVCFRRAASTHHGLPHSAFAPLFAHPIPALQAIGLFLHWRDFFRMNASGERVVNAWCGDLEVDVDSPARNASTVKIPVL